MIPFLFCIVLFFRLIVPVFDNIRLWGSARANYFYSITATGARARAFLRPDGVKTRTVTFIIFRRKRHHSQLAFFRIILMRENHTSKTLPLH